MVGRNPKQGSPKQGSPKQGRGVVGAGSKSAETVTNMIRRAFGASIDLFVLHVPAGIIGIASLAFGIICVDKMGWRTPTDSIEQLTPWAVGFWVAGSVLADVLFTSHWGTTPGKWMVRLTVKDRSGERAALRKMIGRAAWKQVPFWASAMIWPPLVIVVAGVWLVTWVRTRDMLHDRLAGTVVSNRS